jgi:hypothetical protein
MLNKVIRFSTLLRIVGVLCLLWAVFLAARIAFIPTNDIGDPSAQASYLIVTIPVFALGLIIERGILWYAAAGVLLLGFGSQRARLAYWSIQVALWLVGITLWYQLNHAFAPPPQSPLVIIITLLCSLALLALYKPIISLLTKIIRPFKREVKEEPAHVYEPLQMYQRQSADQYNPHEDG